MKQKQPAQFLAAGTLRCDWIISLTSLTLRCRSNRDFALLTIVMMTKMGRDLRCLNDDINSILCLKFSSQHHLSGCALFLSGTGFDFSLHCPCLVH